MSRRAKSLKLPIDPSLSLVEEPTACAKLTNGLIRNNVIIGCPGLNQRGSAVRGIPVKSINYWDDDGIYHLLLLTTRELYEWVSSDWQIRTRVYTTGTVDVSGTTVTGSGTTWLTDKVTTTGRIKFETTDPNVAGDWYEIESVDSDTQITLKSAGPTLSGVSYVITFSYQVDWYVPQDGIDACVVEQPGNNYVVVGSNKDDMTIWNGSGQATLLPGAKALDLHPRILKSFRYRLIAICPAEGSIDYWHRYRWTAEGTYDDWTSTGSGYEDLLGDAGIGFIKAAEVGQNLIIYEDKDTYIVTWIGGTQVFQSVVSSYNEGVAGPHAHVPLHKGTLGFSTRTLNMFHLGANAEDLGIGLRALFNNTLSEDVDYDQNYAFQAAGTYNPQQQIVLFTVPTGYNTKLLVLSESGKPIALWDFNKRVSMLSAFYVYSNLETWEDAVGTWATDTDPWNYQYEESSQKTILLGDADGNIYTLDFSKDSSLTLEFETLPYISDVADRVNEVRVHVTGQADGTIKMEYSTDLGVTWNDTQSYTLSGELEELYFFPNAWGDTFKFRFTMPAVGAKMFYPEMFTIPRRQR